MPKATKCGEDYGYKLKLENHLAEISEGFSQGLRGGSRNPSAEHFQFPERQRLIDEGMRLGREALEIVSRMLERK